MTKRQYFELWYELFVMIDGCNEELNVENVWNLLESIKPELKEHVNVLLDLYQTEMYKKEQVIGAMEVLVGGVDNC